jgi:hypothetical protein
VGGLPRQIHPTIHPPYGHISILISLVPGVTQLPPGGHAPPSAAFFVINSRAFANP